MRQNLTIGTLVLTLMSLLAACSPAATSTPSVLASLSPSPSSSMAAIANPSSTPSPSLALVSPSPDPYLTADHWAVPVKPDCSSVRFASQSFSQDTKRHYTFAGLIIAGQGTHVINFDWQAQANTCGKTLSMTFGYEYDTSAIQDSDIAVGIEFRFQTSVGSKWHTCSSSASCSILLTNEKLYPGVRAGKSCWCWLPTNTNQAYTYTLNMTNNEHATKVEVLIVAAVKNSGAGDYGASSTIIRTCTLKTPSATSFNCSG